jgi:hypothetical protein
MMSRIKGSQATSSEANILLAAQTTAERARTQNLEHQRQGSERIRQLPPCPAPPSLLDDRLRKALEEGRLCPLHPMGDVIEDDILNSTRKYIAIKAALNQGNIPFADKLMSEMLDLPGDGVPDASPLLRIKWMMTRQAGIVRLLGGRWTLKPGLLSLPAWTNDLKKLTNEQLIHLERRTWQA